MSDEDSQTQIVLELAEEFLDRYRKGERPSLGEYTRRHPELAAEIKDVFPAMAMMENIAITDESLAEKPHGATPAAPPLEQLGDYRIIRKIGHGGMGVVYEAEQVSLGRHVALKVLPHQADPKTKKRFEREAKAAAKLHHTNIVPVFGVGEHDGLPYYVMQFIHGLGLDAVLSELKGLRPAAHTPPGPSTSGDKSVQRREGSAAEMARSLVAGGGQAADAGISKTGPGQPESRDGAATDGLADSATLPSLSATLSATLSGTGTFPKKTARKQTYWHSVARIGAQVADALEYAHQQGVYHRDIKPSNLLLDMSGTVWVTDFGLAKAAGIAGDNLTQSGDVLGTPRYMPPEAFEGRTDARSDVYSLGLTLYELLCLRPAFDEKERHRLLKQVLSTEPPRLDRLNRQVPHDLVTIVHKAIEREPDHRYGSAGALAADLKRFINDEPIQARRISSGEQLRRWCRHNPAVAGLLAAVIFLLVGVAGVSTTAAFRIAGARDEATRSASAAVAAKENEAVQRKLAEENARESRERLVRLHVTNGERLLDEGDLLGALPWLTEALRLDQGDERREDMHRRRLAGALAQAPRLVQLWKHEHEVVYAAFSPDGRGVVSVSHDRTARLWDAVTGQALGLPLRHGHIVWKAAFSPDGRRVVTASHDGIARVWKSSNGQSLAALAHQSPVEDVAFSPDGRWVATACTDGTTRLWDAGTGELRIGPLKHAKWLFSVAFSPDGRRLVTASEDSTAQVWDTVTGQPIAPPLQHGGPVRSASFSPDGRTVVTASEDRTARLWNAATGEPIGRPLEHGDSLIRAVFSPDGKHVSTCSYDTTARVWLAATGAAVTGPLKHRNSVRTASFSPDGRYVVTSSYDHTARVWEVATGDAVTPPLRHGSLISNASFSPEGRRVVTASADWTVRVWEIVRGETTPLTVRHGKEVGCASFSPDGRLLATASSDGTARVWSAISGHPLAGPLRHDAAVLHCCFSPDGRRILTASKDRTARVWDVATGQTLVVLRHEDEIVQARFSPDGSRLVTASADHSAQIWDANTGTPLGRLDHGKRLYTAVFSPDSRRVVTASGDGTARVWDAATGAPRTAPMVHEAPVEEASFSPDGSRVVTASADYTARVWDAETGRSLIEPLPHGAGVAAASFSPDGRRIVTGSRRGTARVWDAATGTPVTPLLKHGMGQIRVSFSPDGRYVVTGGGDYAARLWDAATGESLGAPLRHRGWVYHLAFSPDSRRLATACHDGTARIWNLPDPDPRPREDLIALGQVLSTQRIDAKDGPVEVEPAAQRRALEELRSRYPNAFGGSVLEALAWHRREAEACLSERNGPAALFHLLHGFATTKGIVDFAW